MNRNCPICDSNVKTILYHQKFCKTDITIIPEYNVVGCLKCGFCFADNIPTQLEFNKYYEKMSKYETDYTNKEHNQKIFDFIIRGLKDKNARILDIGCGTGGLLKIFKENGFTNLFGLDPSARCVDILLDNGIKALQGSVNNLKLDNKHRFDLIILSSVLEHIVDLKDCMMRVSNLSAPNGLLFVEVPNAARFQGYVFAPFQQFSVEHINYFSHWSIDNLLKMFYFERCDMENMENKINQTIDPCIFTMAVNRYHEPVLNHVTIENIDSYIEICQEKEKELKDDIEDILSYYEKIIIWGCGTFTQMLIGKGILDLSKVSYFVDSNMNYRNKTINYLPIKMPSEINSNEPILISSWSYQEEIAKYISDNFKNEVLKIYE
jgi:SAM-dependent methyltransferase